MLTDDQPVSHSPGSNQRDGGDQITGVHAITPFSMLDYPKENACIIWFAKCNLRCVYCHNPDLVLEHGQISKEEVEAFLTKRQDRLTGVVFSGGEPTLNADLPSYAALAKRLGYKVKLDTNGTRPAVVRKLVEDGLVDMIALDYKCPPEKARALTGTDAFVTAHDDTLAYLIQNRRTTGIIFEIRTTFHPDLLGEDDLSAMIDHLSALGYRGTYFIQAIVSTGDKTLGNIPQPSRPLIPSRLTKPNGYEIAFRNFPTPTLASW